MTQRYDHAGPEPSLAEVLADSGVRLVMRRDRVTPALLDAVIVQGRARLGLAQAPRPWPAALPARLPEAWELWNEVGLAWAFGPEPPALPPTLPLR